MVWQANNGTIFHTRQFLAYHPQDRFIDHSLIFYKKNKPYVLLPAAEVISVPDKMLISHPGASMGSFVVPEDLSIANALELVEALNSYAKNQGFSGVRITLPPTIYNKRQSNYIDFSLLQCGYQYLKREVSSILFLEDSIEENLEKFIRSWVLTELCGFLNMLYRPIVKKTMITHIAKFLKFIFIYIYISY